MNSYRTKILKLRDRIVRKLVLHRIRQHKEIGGWLSTSEAFALYSMAQRIRSGGTIVEIGSWKGKSTFVLARGLRKGTVFTIDPFDASGEMGSADSYAREKGEKPLYDQFIETMTKLQVIHKIKPLVGFSHEFSEMIGVIDFLFIDGDHSMEACSYDFDTYSPKVVEGGYIALHDYDANRDELGPTWVVRNRLIGSNLYEHIGLFDSLWVVRKLGA